MCIYNSCVNDCGNGLANPLVGHFRLLQDTTASVTERVTGTDLIAIAVILASAIVLTRLVRPLLRATLTWLARRSRAAGTGRWKTRVERRGRETAKQSELRRHQRIAATATGLARLVNMFLWVVALLLVLGRVEVDPLFAVSAAGFIGVAISIGGQHAVNDLLTGLQILLEDRFGEGDELSLKVHDDTRTATVVQLGAFATRLRSDDATFHIPNREMVMIVNLSQQGATTEIRLDPTDHLAGSASKTRIEAELRKRYKTSNEFDASLDGIVIDSIDESDDGYSLTIRTARPLSKDQQKSLTRGPSSRTDTASRDPAPSDPPELDLE